VVEWTSQVETYEVAKLDVSNKIAVAVAA